MGMTRAARAPGACDEPFSCPSPHESDPLFFVFVLFCFFDFRPNLHAEDQRADLDISPTLQSVRRHQIKWCQNGRSSPATMVQHHGYTIDDTVISVILFSLDILCS